MLKQYKLRNYKFILVILVITLNILGTLLVGSARPAYLNKQMLGVASAILLMVFVSLIDYKFILKFSWLIYFAMIGLLLAGMLVGDSTGGAQRWIDLGFMKFQPSEIAKIMVIFFFAYYFMKYEEKINTVKTVVIAFALVGVPLVLILKQPDLSTTITTAMIFVSMLFVAGLSYKVVGTVLAIAVPAVVAFFVLVSFFTLAVFFSAVVFFVDDAFLVVVFDFTDFSIFFKSSFSFGFLGIFFLLCFSHFSFLYTLIKLK